MPDTHTNDNTAPIHLDITGMHCAACSSRIEKVVGKMPGIERISVNLASARGEVIPAKDAPDTLLADIQKRIEMLGFHADLAKQDDIRDTWEAARRKEAEALAVQKARLLPLFLLALPLMYISMGHMLGLPLPAWLSPKTAPAAFAAVQLALSLPAVWLGRHFYIDGFGALVRKAPNMDSLVAVGTGSALLYSLWQTGRIAALSLMPGLFGHAAAQGTAAAQALCGDLYFESSVMLLCMISLGQYLEHRSRSTASNAIGELMRLVPDRALRMENGELTETDVSALRVGDTLLVRPGARVPADGTVIEGRSAIDLSLLTGESMPVAVAAGDSLTGGSLNTSGSITMRVDRVGGDTQLSRIMRMVQEAQGTKAPIARLADTLSFYFVPVVIGLAALSALLWLTVGGESPATAIRIFVAVLVIACPCAMGLATPMSIMAATGRGAKLGVLIRSGTALQQAAKINALAIDKTGTLTMGTPVVTDILVVPHVSAPRYDETEVLRLAASMETASEHPLARAIVNEAKERGLELSTAADVQIYPGMGIGARVDEHTVLLGNAALFAEKGIETDAETAHRCNTLADMGRSPMMLAVDGIVSAVIAVADPLRPESAQVVKRLHDMGIRVIMLSGDTERTANAAAREAGIKEVHAGVLPQDKARIVRELQELGYVTGMVGDGINDAPALVQADTGFAVGGGVDVSAEAGDIVLTRNGMNALVTALLLSRAAMRNIRQNLGWAFGYNLLGLPVAAGLLHAFGGPTLSPMFAGTAMAFSSFSVVTNALRLRTIRL